MTTEHLHKRGMPKKILNKTSEGRKEMRKGQIQGFSRLRILRSPKTKPIEKKKKSMKLTDDPEFSEMASLMQELIGKVNHSIVPLI